ncbi:hypothetical protein JW978_02480 [Candidatus Dojkabacteria bacterium]|nr:hypothetical protein [Candidatus Dojkabacteria bacterium]
MISDYEERINQLCKDIETVKIQGATNVALVAMEGMRIAAESNIQEDNLLESVESAGYKLSRARENEPLARNAVKFVLGQIKSNNINHKSQIIEATRQFEEIIRRSKARIIQFSAELLAKYQVILTHCHSSTSTEGIAAAAKKNPEMTVVSTETRPLYQGRKTAKELLDAGVNATQIVDSASASFIVDDRYLPVEAIVIGADEVFMDGRVINKVGSYQIALAAEDGKDEFYVLASLLKIDPTGQSSEPNIEMRPAKEVWEDAPKNLNIINPSFELIPARLVTAYITEAGVLKAEELGPALKSIYPWAY